MFHRSCIVRKRMGLMCCVFARMARSRDMVEFFELCNVLSVELLHKGGAQRVFCVSRAFQERCERLVSNGYVQWLLSVMLIANTIVYCLYGTPGVSEDTLNFLNVRMAVCCTICYQASEHVRACRRRQLAYWPADDGYADADANIADIVAGVAIVVHLMHWRFADSFSCGVCLGNGTEAGGAAAPLLDARLE